jgi:hypothetical protein
MSTAPIFAPDGTIRAIPQESVQDALNAGGRRATLMTDPTGTVRYIPEDLVPQAMQAGGKLYQDPNAPPNTLGDMADVALQGLKGIAQISAPGIAASLINKTAPGLAAKLQQVPYIGPLMQQAAPLKNIPGMATAAMASPLAEGMETGDLAPNPNPQPQPAPASPNPASPNGSSLLKIMSRHIPIVGRGLRAMDTVQELQDLVNGPAPSPQPASTPTPTQIPETNGIPWGSGGQGPLEWRGKMIPRSAVYPGAPYPENPGTFPGAPYPATQSSEVLQGNALARGAQSGQPLPGAALGQIPSTQIQAAPQTPNVQAQPAQPAASFTPQPAPMLQFDPVANSSQLAGHAYDPQTQTATMQFKNGQVHQYYGVTPDDWANYLNYRDSAGNPSPGKGFQAYIKRDPATGAGRTSRPLTATGAKSTVQEAPPATANELLERYIGLF